jgi:hypothetical protein
LASRRNLSHKGRSGRYEKRTQGTCLIDGPLLRHPFVIRLGRRHAWIHSRPARRAILGICILTFTTLYRQSFNLNVFAVYNTLVSGVPLAERTANDDRSKGCHGVGLRIHPSVPARASTSYESIWLVTPVTERRFRMCNAHVVNMVQKTSSHESDRSSLVVS